MGINKDNGSLRSILASVVSIFLEVYMRSSYLTSNRKISFMIVFTIIIFFLYLCKNRTKSSKPVNVVILVFLTN